MKDTGHAHSHSAPPSDLRASRRQGAVQAVVRAATLALVFTVSSGCPRESEDAPSVRSEPASTADQPSVDAVLVTPDVKAGHTRMIQQLKTIAETTPEMKALLGDAAVEIWRERVAQANRGASAVQQSVAHFNLGSLELQHGREQKAIELLTRALELLPGSENLPPGTADRVRFQLAIAYLRLGETQNCCRMNTPDSCLLPIRGGGIHTKTAGSEQAIPHLLEILKTTSPRSRSHLAARWMLNIAYMTLGRYPDDVPREHLIPPAAFESQETFPRFPNVAAKVGVGTFSLAGGAVADDFDGDGYLDLLVSTWDLTGQLRYFRNDRSGRFVERTEEAGLAGITGGLNLVHADYDNDGHVDVLVLRTGWIAAGHPNSLLRNLGGVRFVDRTYAAGLADVNYPTQTAAWADYDNDGDLDLYIGNETSKSLAAPSQLFRNNGDGTFTDVAREAGVTNDRLSKGVVWGDYDEDRWPDLYVSNYTNPNRLYRNNGDGTFADVAAKAGVEKPVASFPAWFWDFDNDGNLDIYVSAYAASISEIAASYVGVNHGIELACLYRGNGQGGFRDVAREQGLTAPNAPMGANFGDLDGDGYLDFYLGTGWPAYHELTPNLMFRNRGGHGFSDVTIAGGFGQLQKGHAVIFVDIDHDGDQDVFEQMGGWYPGDRYFDALYENPGFESRWLTLKLVGVRSNRSAIGARIRVDVIESGGARRSIYRHVTSGGSFGANPFRQFIGLGRATKIDSLEIFWPTSNLTQTFRDVPLDRHLLIIETEAGYTVRELKRYELAR